MIVMAKGLGGGVPIGAIGTTEAAAEGLSFREGGAVPHASTFGGNPFACCAALTGIETIEREGLLENCLVVGEHLGERFADADWVVHLSAELPGENVTAPLGSA